MSRLCCTDREDVSDEVVEQWCAYRSVMTSTRYFKPDIVHAVFVIKFMILLRECSNDAVVCASAYHKEVWCSSKLEF